MPGRKAAENCGFFLPEGIKALKMAKKEDDDFQPYDAVTFSNRCGLLN